MLALFVVMTCVAVFAGSYGESVVRMAGYVATIALGAGVALLVQHRRERRTSTRPPR
jgi:hypothetical protein